jgi:hypothetical protein
MKQLRCKQLPPDAGYFWVPQNMRNGGRCGPLHKQVIGSARVAFTVALGGGPHWALSP